MKYYCIGTRDTTRSNTSDVYNENLLDVNYCEIFLTGKL